MSTATDQETKPQSGNQPGENKNQPQNQDQNKDQKNDKPADPAKRRRLIGFAVIGLILAVIIAIPIYLHYASIESTDDAQVDGHITPISPRVGGTVLSVEVNDNEPVGVGKVLVRIDPRDYQVALDRAKADLADAVASTKAAQSDVPVTSTSASGGLQTAEAALNEARAGEATAQANITAARDRATSAVARVAEAQANYDKAARDLERYRELVSKDEISRQQFDAAAAAAAAAKATLDSARASANEAAHNVDVAQSSALQARARIGQAQAQVSQASSVPQQVAISRARATSAQAKVQQQESAVKQAELNLSYTTIVAPVAGLVGRKQVEVGQIVQPGQQLMTIIPITNDKIFITANFKETQLKKMQIGQPVDIKVDAFGGRVFKGHIDSFAPATGARFSVLPPENATGNYVKVVQRVPVKIVLDPGEDPGHILRPGMSVDPVVHIDAPGRTTSEPLREQQKQ